MEKILVATDGSANSKRALIEAKKYAENLDSTITIVNVVKPLSYTTLGYQAIDIQPHCTTFREIGASILKESLKFCDDFEGEVNTILREGSPAEQILQEAEEGNYDLIVMGNRGLGVFSKTLLGSVSTKVLNHTKRNVLIVK